jgi:mannose-6-phosphate isomerase-like protein (cupin superfamily)
MRSSRCLRAALGVVVLAGIADAGCTRTSRTPRLVWEGAGGPRAGDARTATAALPQAAPGVRMGPWGETPDASFLLLAAEADEVPHVHDEHDLTVVILEGGGWLAVEDRRWDLAAGDVVHVRRGTVHHFHPAPGRPVIGLAVYSPRLVGRDFRPVTAK